MKQAGKNGILAALKRFWNYAAVRQTRRVLRVMLRCVVTVLLVCVITVSIVGSVVAVYVVLNYDGRDGLPDLEAISNNETSFVYTMNDKGDWEISQNIQGANQIWADLEDIPVAMKYAVISIEDERFEEHEGVDWKRTVSAFVNLFLHFSDREYGGSTITQQLIKVVTGNNDHSIPRKITEIMQAIEMERTVATKDDIIEAYLNVLPLSGSIKGVGMAAHKYFAKDVSDLSIAECALIAGITQSPSYYNPYTHPDHARERQRLVLAQMYRLGHITEDEYIQALGEELVFKSLGSSSVQNYYTDMVIEDVIQDLMKVYGYNYAYAEQMVFYGGLNIYSMEDAKIQKIAEEIYADEKNFPDPKKSDDGDNPQGAIFIMDYNGRVVATVGQRGAKTADRISNFGTQAQRQCGSAIKPLSVYALAVDKNLVHYSSLVRDCYITLPDGTKWPSNVNSKPKDNGNVLLEMAVQKSLNTVPVRLLQEIGLERSFDFMTTTLGFSTLHRSLVSNGKVHTDVSLAPLALGGLTTGVTVREMTAAYQIFGNGGTYQAPYSYAKVTRGDEVLLSHKEDPVKAVSADSAYVMNRLLQQVVRGSKGTARDLADSWKDWQVFAKTGTTTDNNDSYFVGGTSKYVAASWLGYKHNKTLTSAQKKYARLLWNKVMTKVHKGEADAGFTMPDSVQERYYCLQSGQLATTACPNKALGVYKNNFLPGACQAHGGSASSGTSASGSNTSASVPLTTVMP